MRGQFKKTVMDLAREDDRIALVLGDISVYMFREFQQLYPERFFNMGICENTLVSVAAGLSSQGFHPFVHSIAPFLTERSFEQIKLDMCYNGFGGNIVTCGATFDYAWDGATHQCATDLAILRLLPDCVVLQPGSRREVDALLRARYASGGTTYYRLSDNPHGIDMDVELGRGVVVRNEGAPVTVMTAGPILENVVAACRGHSVNIVYFHTLKPIDRELVWAFRNTRILVVQDAHGLYEAIAEVPGLRLYRHGLPDAFLRDYGKIGDMRALVGLDPQGIERAVSALLDEKD
jgi:transketolase